MSETTKQTPIWGSDDCRYWRDVLDGYPQVILEQESARLVELDDWYRLELPPLLSERPEPHVTLEELQRITNWKMRRGVWRERNRRLVGQNSPERVVAASREAFAVAPDLRKPIGVLSELSGVGPATASGVMAVYAPQHYPFFDELVAVQIPGLGPVAFTTKYYVEYAEALRERASQLSDLCGHVWTPQDVAQAMWAASGGKPLG